MAVLALHPKPTARVMAVPPIYRAILLEIERRRLAVGISMDRVSELMGAAERSYAKMLYPDTPSGRMAQWQTLQSVVDVLFCDGYELRIVPATRQLATASKGYGVRTTEGTKRLIKHEAATWDRRIRREMLTDMASSGGNARAAKLSPARRSEIARSGGLARAANAQLATASMIHVCVA